jgi:glyoxylase-like metal-dependent hydrolase (beta-lactamase superfamily II)
MMKRAFVLGVLIALGSLSITTTAQRGGANEPMVVEVDKIKDNLFVLRGGGGNTAAFVTANGVVLVDTKNSGWGQPILEKVKTLTNKPITMVINTHWHPDHTSGQLEFTGNIEYVSHESAKASMQKQMQADFQKNPKALPSRTYKDKLSLLTGNDRVELYYFGPGHTNGDSWVVFPALRVVHAGDIFAGKNVPLVDFGNGGSGVRYPETLTNAYKGLNASVDTIITGHANTTLPIADLKQYAAFNADFLSWVRAQQKAGKSPEQVAAEYKVPDAYPGYGSNLPPFFGGMAGYIKGMYTELGAK